MEAAANYHQNELLREAKAHRAAHEAGLDGHSSQHHQLVVAAVAVLLALMVIALI